jgi:hypothetical protein
LKDLGVNRRIILKWILSIYSGKVWTGFVLFRTGAGDRLL